MCCNPAVPSALIIKMLNLAERKPDKPLGDLPGKVQKIDSVVV